jgi:iron complex outermembrane recepter protein
MSFKLMLLATVGSAALAMPAYAQQASAPQPASELEVVVVTAQKRDQNLQSVPVSVTAISSATIANQRLADFADLTRVAPSLTITQTSSSPNNSINLRGIGTFAFSIGVEPSVAVIIDDMPVVQQAQAFDNMADLQRIEVLKGPQGTLFGKNSSAGVISIVTKDPSREFEGMVSATVASDDDVRAEGAVSVPLGEKVGVRLTGFYHNFEGTLDNLTTGGKLNDQENYGFRAKMRAEIGENLIFTLTGAYGKAEQGGTGPSIRAIIGTGTPRVFGSPALPLIPSLVGITPGEDNYRARLDSVGATTNETKSLAAKFNLDLGFATLIAVSAVQNWEYTFQNDFDNTDLNVLSAFTGGATNGGLTQFGPYKSTNFTQELRLVSSGEGALKYILGGFYSDATTNRAFTRGPVVAVANWEAENSSESIGVFAQLDYKLPTNTTISGGVRYNHETIGVAFDNRISTATANQCAVGTAACRGTNEDSVVTWKGSIAQELAPAVMVYASVASGYKGYAYDIVTGFNPARVTASLNGTGAGLIGVGPIKPETSVSYELGLKSRFFSNKLQLNVIGFSTEYEDFQAQSAILVGSPPSPQFVLNNVGKLRTQGVEIELSAKLKPWLRLDAGLSFTDAVMTEFPNAQGYPGQTGQVFNTATGTSALVGNCSAAPAATLAAPRTTCQFQDRSGANLPNSPKIKWNVGLYSDFAMTPTIDGSFNLSYQFQDDVNFDLLGNPLLVQDAYGIVNTSFSMDFGKTKATVFINNLLDQHYASSLTDNFGISGGSATNDTHPITQFLTRDSRRYVGIKVGYSF